VLSTFLSQLQNYFSKYFIIGSFVPMLAFAFVNSLTVYFLFPTSQKFIDDLLINPTRGAFFTTSLMLAIAAAAYVLSSLSTFLRGVLEGRWPWVPKFLVAFFVATQNARRERMLGDLYEAKMDRVDLAEAHEWEQQMKDAWQLGKSHSKRTFTADPHNDEVEIALQAMERKRDGYDTVDVDELEKTARKIAERLQQNDPDVSPDLTREQQRLGALIDYAKERALARHARLQNELNSNFGAQDLASTTMGNVANTIQSYALRRYRCNFEAVWSNLQRIVQKDDKAQAALQEAKTQLDFLVACCWLTLLSAFGWALVFSCLARSRLGFLLAALAEPAIAYMWYRAASEQYRSFADIAMTSLDSFRLYLLRDMQLTLPADVEDERNMWENIDLLTTYGANRNFRYTPLK
jgi:hypothetical protein